MKYTEAEIREIEAHAALFWPGIARHKFQSAIGLEILLVKKRLSYREFGNIYTLALSDKCMKQYLTHHARVRESMVSNIGCTRAEAIADYRRACPDAEGLEREEAARLKKYSLLIGKLRFVGEADNLGHVTNWMLATKCATAEERDLIGNDEKIIEILGRLKQDSGAIKELLVFAFWAHDKSEATRKKYGGAS